MKKHRILCILLSLMLLLSLFAGCTKKDPSEDGSGKDVVGKEDEEKKDDEREDEDKKDADEGEGEAEELDKPDEIIITKTYYFGDASDNPDLKESWAESMEEQFGIKLHELPA
ncbi:MAG: hypothetical protein GX974_00825 [Clostridiales bacterium]|nr:hypothetical protein [Clostridiales bacterium]